MHVYRFFVSGAKYFVRLACHFFVVAVGKMHQHVVDVLYFARRLFQKLTYVFYVLVRKTLICLFGYARR